MSDYISERDATKCPENIRKALDRWVNQGIYPGSFTLAVLTNDLMGAYTNADANSYNNLGNILAYVYWEIPGNCWGSEEIIEKWAKKFSEGR